MFGCAGVKPYLPGYTILFNPQNNGFCLRDSLNFMGVENMFSAWPTYQEIARVVPDHLINSNQGMKLVGQMKPVMLLLDFHLHHACVVTPRVGGNCLQQLMA